MIEVFNSGIEDIVEGIRKRRVWIALASEDISDQHRRTTLGPLWLLINYLAFAGTFIAIFSNRIESINFPAYIAVGLFVWLYISEVAIQSISLFVKDESYIKGTTLPLSVYVFQLMVQSTIRACFALVGCLAILFLSGVVFSNSWIYSLAGIILLVATTPAAILVLAMAGAFFPDLQFVVLNLMRLGMFLTPIFWMHNNDGGIRSMLYFWNPFTYYLDIVRTPILSGTFPTNSFVFCIILCCALWGLAIYLLGKNRKKVAFVL